MYLCRINKFYKGEGVDYQLMENEIIFEWLYNTELGDRVISFLNVVKLLNIKLKYNNSTSFVRISSCIFCYNGDLIIYSNGDIFNYNSSGGLIRISDVESFKVFENTFLFYNGVEGCLCGYV